MYTPSDTNNALKRRRLDEETPPHVQETGHPAFTTSYQAGYGPHTGLFAAKQFYPTSVPQSVSATPQLDPIGVYSTISPHHNNTWNPYHTFQSQNATGSWFNEDNFQSALINSQQPSPSFASSWFDLWPSMSMGDRMLQEQAQNYPQILPKSLCQQHLLDAAQGSSSLQPWQSAVCVEAQYLDITTIVTPNNVLPAAPTPAQQLPEEQVSEKVCFGMVSWFKRAAR